MWPDNDSQTWVCLCVLLLLWLSHNSTQPDVFKPVLLYLAVEVLLFFLWQTTTVRFGHNNRKKNERFSHRLFFFCPCLFSTLSQHLPTSESISMSPYQSLLLGRSPHALECKPAWKEGLCLQGNFTKLWDPQHRLALSNTA